MVVVSGKGDGQLRMLDRAAAITSYEGQRSAIELDARRQTSQLSLVGHDESGRQSAEGSVGPFGPQGVREVLELPISPLELVGCHQGPDKPQGQHRPKPYHLLGDGVDPAPDRPLLAYLLQRRYCEL